MPDALLNECIRTLNVILLVPHGRSGSMLMQSLFDGHDQVISFPYWFKQYSWNVTPSATVHDIVEAFCGQGTLFGGAALQMATNRDAQPSIDVAAFKVQLTAILESVERLDDRVVFICAHLALARVLGRDLGTLKYILLHVHAYREIPMSAVLADFPDLYFIAMHRDPREDWVSYVRGYHWEFGQQDLLNKLMEFIETRLVDWHGPFLAIRRACAAGRVKIVDLNRLHRLQEEAMRALAAWLGIDWSAILTQSTFLGRAWAGNSFLGTPIYGFSGEKAEYTWPRKLSARDVQVIDYFYFPILGALRYKRPDQRPSRRTVRRRLLLSKPSIFVPRSGSLYLKGRESINRQFELGLALADQGQATDWLFPLIRRVPKKLARELFVAKHRVGLARVGLRELMARYGPARFRRLEAIADLYQDVRFADAEFI